MPIMSPSDLVIVLVRACLASISRFFWMILPKRGSYAYSLMAYRLRTTSVSVLVRSSSASSWSVRARIRALKSHVWIGAVSARTYHVRADGHLPMVRR